MRGLLPFLASRILRALVALWLVSTVVFVVMRLSGDPDGMMWRLLGPGGPQDYWRHARWDELGEAARFSVDEKFRETAYREMTKIFLEHLPWIPIIQPYEDYGIQKYVEWTPDPLQQLEIRRFNLKLRRA